MGYGKKYRSVSEKVDVNMDCELGNAISFLQENPTAKFESIFILSGKLLIVSASNLSVKEDNIPSHPWLNSINFFWEYNSSFIFKFAS